MPSLNDAISGWMSQYPYFTPNTVSPPPSQNTLEIPQAAAMPNYGVNPQTGDPMPDPNSVLRRLPPPINVASDPLVTGQIMNPATRALALPQELAYRAVQPGAVGMLGPQHGEMAANVMSMLLPMLIGDLAGARAPEGRMAGITEEQRAAWEAENAAARRGIPTGTKVYITERPGMSGSFGGKTGTVVGWPQRGIVPVRIGDDVHSPFVYISRDDLEIMPPPEATNTSIMSDSELQLMTDRLAREHGYPNPGDKFAIPKGNK